LQETINDGEAEVCRLLEFVESKFPILYRREHGKLLEEEGRYVVLVVRQRVMVAVDDVLP